jgi:clan AA aspartic protease
MGKVMAKVRLSNVLDEGNARQGLIPNHAVRGLEIEALVDTGATMLALPEDVVALLGLTETERRKVKLADGSVREVGQVSDLRVEILGRRMTSDALVMPAGSPPLIGQVQLEVLDLVVDAKSRDVMVNPASPDMPTLDLMAS